MFPFVSRVHAHAIYYSVPMLHPIACWVGNNFLVSSTETLKTCPSFPSSGCSSLGDKPMPLTLKQELEGYSESLYLNYDEFPKWSEVDKVNFHISQSTSDALLFI